VPLQKVFPSYAFDRRRSRSAEPVAMEMRHDLAQVGYFPLVVQSDDIELIQAFDSPTRRPDIVGDEIASGYFREIGSDEFLSKVRGHSRTVCFFNSQGCQCSAVGFPGRRVGIWTVEVQNCGQNRAALRQSRASIST
jgi:hypothetical protein